LIKARFDFAWVVTVFVLVEASLLDLVTPDDFQQNYGGSPLNKGITNSPVRDSLGILCNDFDDKLNLANGIELHHSLSDE
jgi:hypothetical protein